MYMESYSKSSANAVTRIRHTPLLLTLGAHFGIDCIPAKKLAAQHVPARIQPNTEIFLGIQGRLTLRFFSKERRIFPFPLFLSDSE